MWALILIMYDPYENNRVARCKVLEMVSMEELIRDVVHIHRFITTIVERGERGSEIGSLVVKISYKDPKRDVHLITFVSSPLSQNSTKCKESEYVTTTYELYIPQGIGHLHDVYGVLTNLQENLLLLIEKRGNLECSEVF
jgi:hypothetical protein